MEWQLASEKKFGEHAVLAYPAKLDGEQTNAVFNGVLPGVGRLLLPDGVISAPFLKDRIGKLVLPDGVISAQFLLDRNPIAPRDSEAVIRGTPLAGDIACPMTADIGVLELEDRNESVVGMMPAWGDAPRGVDDIEVQSELGRSCRDGAPGEACVRQ